MREFVPFHEELHEEVVDSGHERLRLLQELDASVQQIFSPLLARVAQLINHLCRQKRANLKRNLSQSYASVIRGEWVGLGTLG